MKLTFKWQQRLRSAWLAPGRVTNPGRQGLAGLWVVAAVLLIRFCSPLCCPCPVPATPHSHTCGQVSAPEGAQMCAGGWHQHLPVAEAIRNPRKAPCIPAVIRDPAEFPFLMHFLLGVSGEGNAAR